MPTFPQHNRRPSSSRRSGSGRWALAAWATLAAGVLAACGGGSHKEPSTLASVATTTAVTSTPTTATTAGKPAKHADAKRPVKPATPAPATSTTTRVSTPAGKNPTAVDPANTHPTIAGPQPKACLASAGLLGARTGREPGVWEGNWGTTSTKDLNAIVFVDGPYKNKQAASQAAQQLLGTEYAAAGGRWEVSASLPSHLSPQVKKVAACLGASAGAAGGKSYSF